ncbi:phosphoglycerate mutase-like protein [Pisolithus marmoratus]|nr:phosphoglycerate mutase-like protein [Pisolithus marmoratus]
MYDMYICWASMNSKTWFSLDMTLFRLYIVRHGETDWNRTRRTQGQTDVPLNETGIAQAALVAQALKEVPFVKAYTSDLQRASKTAEVILRYHPSVTLEKDGALREVYMGELEGEFRDSVKVAPSKETTEALMRRWQAWYSRAIVGYMLSKVNEGIAGDGIGGPECILVVSHGALLSNMLRVLVANGAVLPAQGVVVGRFLNTGVTVIDYFMQGQDTGGCLKGMLVKFSDATHLACTKVAEENVDELVYNGAIPSHQ